MQWNILFEPIVGAIIGYVTNNIAVKMLFKPLNPIYIGKFHVPFTPGIIPKGKHRLGKAIGDAVGNSLLTPTIIKETLLSDHINLEIQNQINLFFENLKKDSTTIHSFIQPILSESDTNESLKDKVVILLSNKISSELESMNIGEIVANEVMSAVNAKIQGTMLAMFVKPELLAPIADEIEIRINRYMTEHGEEKVRYFIENEYMNFMEQPISQMMGNIDVDEFKHKILKLYRTIINNYSEKFLSTLNLSKIVEEKINAMDTEEVENLILSIMKKELGAIVNLGAVIGFVLGLLNLLF